MSILNIPSEEIVRYAEMLSIERAISKSLVFEALEESFNDAVKKKFGLDYNISVKINKKDGTINVSKILEVVESQKNIISVYKQITLSDAVKLQKDVVIGDVIDAKIPNLELTSDIMSFVRKGFLNKLTQIARQNEYDEFSKITDTVVSGIVKRTFPSGIVVLLGKTECFVAKKEMLFQEANSYKVNDRISIAIKNTERSERGFQVFGTRTSNTFLANILKQNIGEIEEGIVEIKAIARDAGSRSKVAVFSLDRTKDAVGICIGGKGRKINSVTKELKDEKIDVVEWNSDPIIFTQNCLKGIAVDSIEVISENEIEVVLQNEFISTAIGRRGQNASLISQLVGFKVSFVSSDEKMSIRTTEFETRTNVIMNIIGVDEIIAKILITEGFGQIAKISSIGEDVLAAIPGFNAEIVSQIKNRTNEVVEGLSSDDFARDLINQNVSVEAIFQLFQNDINNNVELASLSVDDFIEIVGAWCLNETFNKDVVSSIIMQKRKELGLID